MEHTAADHGVHGRGRSSSGRLPAEHRYETPTGEPCPRAVRLDGAVDGTGHCHGCGVCLLGSGLV